MTNEPYEPYKVGADWYYDCKRGTRGPFISEEACQKYAENAREAEEG